MARRYLACPRCNGMHGCGATAKTLGPCPKRVRHRGRYYRVLQLRDATKHDYQLWWGEREPMVPRGCMPYIGRLAVVPWKQKGD